MAEDVWKQLERMRLELTDNTHIQRPLLEAMIDQHKAVEAARHAALDYIRDLEERNDALAAHVERLLEGWDDLYASDAGTDANREAAKAMTDAFCDTPETSLARLIAEKQAEALEETAMKRPPGSVQRAWLLEQAEEMSDG